MDLVDDFSKTNSLLGPSAFGAAFRERLTWQFSIASLLALWILSRNQVIY
jgi:hypothetical protein